uniref:Ig-like domain-containing protein n=1 Tax=Oreochromis niloticus TaxID=8128 RepID=A0A669E476_ORENI
TEPGQKSHRPGNRRARAKISPTWNPPTWKPPTQRKNLTDLETADPGQKSHRPRTSDWNVMRITSQGPTRSACGSSWGRRNGSSCTTSMTLPWDTGVYWCESKNGQTSEMQNLTVTAGSVILQTGVAMPITEGDDLTLVCVTKKPTKNWSAFYKDGSLISSVPTGRLTIRNVAKSDEGVYNCETERDGKSPSSWIAVTETTRGEFVSEGPLLESTSPETTTGGLHYSTQYQPKDKETQL